MYFYIRTDVLKREPALLLLLLLLLLLVLVLVLVLLLVLLLRLPLPPLPLPLPPPPPPPINKHYLCDDYGHDGQCLLVLATTEAA